MTAPAIYARHPRELSPAMERLFRERGWIDRRTCERLARPDPGHVAMLYRIRGLEPAPGPGTDVTC